MSEDKVKQCVDPKLNNDYPPKAVAKVRKKKLLRNGSSVSRNNAVPDMLQGRAHLMALHVSAGSSCSVVRAV